MTARELSPAVAVLQLFLNSSKPVLRFAAVRMMNRVAMTHPIIASSCNIDMETLIADANRSIATLAITTLLKTGHEGSVEKLLKQIGTFMSDIAGLCVARVHGCGSMGGHVCVIICVCACVQICSSTGKVIVAALVMWQAFSSGYG